MDVYTSVVALLLVGWGAGLLAQLTRLPRVVVMIFAGIALMPAMHPTVLSAASLKYGPATASTPTYGPTDTYPTVSPASSIRTMALLVALMRGGLNVKLKHLFPRGWPVLALAFLPYALEMAVEAAVAPIFLPSYYTSAAAGKAPTALVTWASASVWAPLSPSIVIPNTLLMVESGYRLATQVVLMGAPLEISSALLTEGVMASVQDALNAGNDPAVTLAHIPVYVIGSALWGLMFALFYVAYVKLRQWKALGDKLGMPKGDAPERLFVFVAMFILCYTTSDASENNTPWLIGFFAALFMAMSVEHLITGIGDELAATLKVAWFYAECMLFVLTGCVIRPAIDLGLGLDLFGWYFAVLVVGTLGRMAGDVVVGLAWQFQVNRSRGRASPALWTRADWVDVLRRTAFVWMCTIPKATLQASLGPKLATTFKAGGFTAAGLFIAPSCAIAILYAATIGNLLVYSAGFVLLRHLETEEIEDLATLGPHAVGGVAEAELEAMQAAQAAADARTAAEAEEEARAAKAVAAAEAAAAAAAGAEAASSRSVDAGEVEVVPVI